MASGLKKIGKYLFLEEQEHGLLGAMWRVGEIAGGKLERNLLALQVSTELAADARFRDQYLKQSPVTGKLEHPNILRKINTSSEGNELISYYEYQEGFSLEKVIKRCQSEMNPFSVDHALLVVSKLLSALAYAKTKHLTHGFVNPGMVFVTHEGEVKLQGFALSSALRVATVQPQLSAYHRSYIPAGMSYTSEDRDRLDIFGCGAILYEMLVGESFKGGDVPSVVGSVETALEGEPIPPKIAKIIIDALDNTRPTSYKDIQKMAKDMDELLFSGEYSPTTFNLAFFMHSAFRLEMEELGSKIASEKDRDYSEKSAPTPAPVAVAAPAPRIESVPEVSAPRQVSTPIMPAAPAKSKTPMLLGAVAVVLVIIIAVLLMKPKGAQPAPNVDQIGAELAKEGMAQDKQLALSEQEQLRLQNEELQQLLREQSQDEKRRKLEDLKAEMEAMDRKIVEAKKLKEADEQRRTMQAELERLKKMVEEREKVAQAPVKPKPKEEQKVDSKPQPTQIAEQPKQPVVKPAEAPAPKQAEPASQPEAAPAADKTPPQFGELVLLEDELLQRPNHVTKVPTVPVPKKVIKDGLLSEGQRAYYIVTVLVSETGEVTEAKVHRSPLPINAFDHGLEDKVIKTALKMKFTVPSKLGVPVRVWSYATIHLDTTP